MRYPNSVTSARGAARPSPSPSKPVPRPRPQPTPHRPRRPPGRPQPHRPRRPPGPSPLRPPPPVRPHPGKPGRFPDRTPKLPYLNKPPRLPPIWKRLPLIGAGIGLWYTATKPGDPWEPGDTYGPWILWNHCIPPVADSTPQLVAHRMFGQNGADINACYVNQAGFWDGVTVNPGPPWNEATPGSTARTRNRIVIQFVGSINNFARVHSVFTWYRRHTNPEGGIPGIDGPPYFTGPDSLYPQPGHWKVPPSQAPAPLPDDVPSPWYLPFFPPWTPPGQVPNNPDPPPVLWPPTRPEPWSPESPDVGPRPDPRPKPEPKPDPDIPVPPDLPDVIPEVVWTSAPFSPGLIQGRGAPRPLNRPQEKRVRRPPRGTKERKVRMSPLMSFLWNSFNPVTEGIDMVNFMYECLPWKLKVDEYKSRGKQPNPADKAQIIYQNINALDVGCAITSYLEEQIEDMLYAIGSQKLGEAAKKDLRPIGYEAGGGLTGGAAPWVGPIT